MASLPIDVQLARLIVFGQIFGVYDSCLTIGLKSRYLDILIRLIFCIYVAAAMYVRNLLSTPFKERLDAYVSKIGWSNGSGSDSIALLNAFKV